MERMEREKEKEEGREGESDKCIEVKESRFLRTSCCVCLDLSEEDGRRRGKD